MKNKILSVALMMITAIAVIVAPIAIEKDNAVPAAQTSSVTSATTTRENKEEDTPSATTTTTAPDSSEAPDESTTTKTVVSEDSSQAPDTAVTTQEKPKETTTTAKKQTTTTTTAKKTTTTTKKQEPPVNDAPSGTPVSNHGQLSVNKANIVDESGNKFQLIGMSTHGLGWFPTAVSKNSFKVLRDDWGCNVVRLAMYIEESWGGSESLYLADPDTNYKLVTKGIDACIDLGMYVVVDWHILNPGDPTTHTAEAKAFFKKIAQEYGDCPNIIYEVCNEPNGGNVTWSGKIKPYCESVINEIRKYDDDAIIVCGTGTWSQDIDKVVGNEIDDDNVVYALHFYAHTHTDWLRNRVTSCYNSGLPILVTEFGTCDASGNSGYDESQTKTWLKLLDKYNIGYMNWSFCDKSETAAAFRNGTNLSSISSGTGQLTESGKLIRSLFRKRTGLD